MDSVSCNVEVVSVTANTGGEGATAVLRGVQGGGIDLTPGDEDTLDITVQITADADDFVVAGAILQLTLAKQQP